MKSKEGKEARLHVLCLSEIAVRNWRPSEWSRLPFLVKRKALMSAVPLVLSLIEKHLGSAVDDYVDSLTEEERGEFMSENGVNK